MRLLLPAGVSRLLPLLGGLLLPRSREGAGTPGRVLPPEWLGGVEAPVGRGPFSPFPMGPPIVGTPPTPSVGVC